MKNFRVTHIIGNLGTGGTQRHLYYLIKHRTPQFADTSLLTLPMQYQREDKHYETLIRQSGVQPEYISNLTSFRYAKLIYKIYRRLRQQRPHIVHNWMFDFNAVGSVAASLAATPVSLSTVEITTDNIEQTWWPPVNTENKNFLRSIKLAARLADVTICNSAHLTAQYEQWAGIECLGKTATIPNGIDMDLFTPSTPAERDAERAALGISPFHIVIGIMNRIAPEKDHDTYLNMAAIIAKTEPRAKFLIVGGLKDDEDADPAPQFRSKLEQLGIAEKTIFTGKTYRAREMLSAMDIAVSSSIQEGSSNYLIEAQAMALPAVATDVSGSAEIIQHEKTGYIVPPRNPQALAARVLQIIDNPQLAAQMSQLAQTTARATFTIEKMVNSTENLYRQLLENKGYKTT